MDDEDKHKKPQIVFPDEQMTGYAQSPRPQGERIMPTIEFYGSIESRNSQLPSELEGSFKKAEPQLNGLTSYKLPAVPNSVAAVGHENGSVEFKVPSPSGSKA